MKKILFICTSILDEAGKLHIHREVQLRLLLSSYANQHDTTVLVQAKRDKVCELLHGIPGVRVYYDAAVPDAKAPEKLPTKNQMLYAQFSNCDAVPGAYDWAIAWDGLAPYALATLLERVHAESKAVMVLDDPKLFLMSADRNFMFQAYSKLSRIAVPTEDIKEALAAHLHLPLFALDVPVSVFDLPEDLETFRQKSEEPFEDPFHPGAMRLLAIARMGTESKAEQLPALIAARKQRGEQVHCCLVGDGPRRQRYLYQIAIWDVNEYFSLIGERENLFPLLRHCDGVFLPDEEPDGPLHKAAALFGVPVLLADT